MLDYAIHQTPGPGENEETDTFFCHIRVLVITHDFQEKVINPDFQILFKQISDIITGVKYPPPR